MKNAALDRAAIERITGRTLLEALGRRDVGIDDHESACTIFYLSYRLRLAASKVQSIECVAREGRF